MQGCALLCALKTVINICLSLLGCGKNGVFVDKIILVIFLGSSKKSCALMPGLSSPTFVFSAFSVFQVGSEKIPEGTGMREPHQSRNICSNEDSEGRPSS